MRILITGSTDGIGLETAKLLVEQGYEVIIHGRNQEKIIAVKAMIKEKYNVSLDSIKSDLSDLKAVDQMADHILDKYDSLDVLINNAGVFVTPHTETSDDLDIRFAVNTYAPYILAKKLMPLLHEKSRIVNLSSAAQAPVDTNALSSYTRMTDGDAYAQSKLALTMWSIEMKDQLPVVIAVNPKSFLGSKMVKQAYGSEGYDLGIGADILVRASLSDEFKDARGLYYDNDIKSFSNPHPHALNRSLRQEVISILEDKISSL